MKAKDCALLSTSTDTTKHHHIIQPAHARSFNNQDHRHFQVVLPILFQSKICHLLHLNVVSIKRKEEAADFKPKVH